MGYVFDFHDAKAYEQWFNNPNNRFATTNGNRLIVDMLKPAKGDTALDIGCGTGERLLSFLEMGLQVTGLDPSPYALDIAFKKVQNRVDFYRGFAEDLPFDDNSFNYAFLITTLEFVDDPQKAIEEASRVAKDKIFIGMFNRYAIKGVKIRVEGILNRTVFNHAQFFSVWELKQMIRSILGKVPITWRTICQSPSTSGKFASRIKQSGLMQRYPFGSFAAIVVTLVPRFKTRPLAMKYREGHSGEAVAGYTSGMLSE
ncbi:MAG TPA: class I SAM-dependent methyltransferase [Desulfobacterales bacterium]|nr:class I SAM-dependent methyltransferase [Desulfobacterales bacterium]